MSFRCRRLTLHNNTKAAISLCTESLYVGPKVKPLRLSSGKTVLGLRDRTETLAYGKGRQTQITTQAGDVSITNEITEYDALGRVLGSRQVIGTDSYAFRYGYL